jgi:hypothetical protein
MRTFAKALCALVLALGALASVPAQAHGGVRFGFHFGIPLGYPAPYYPPYYSPYYYPPPVYYYPPPVVNYVEQPAAQPAPQSSPQSENSWYYCRDTQNYYPYVKECASPWQRVAPRPPGS